MSELTHPPVLPPPFSGLLLQGKDLLATHYNFSLQNAYIGSQFCFTFHLGCNVKRGIPFTYVCPSNKAALTKIVSSMDTTWTHKNPTIIMPLLHEV